MHNSQPFNSDGCTMVPDLWLNSCCVAHDYAAYITGKEAGDLGFLLCVLGHTIVVAIVASLTYWLGMITFRPLYRLYQKHSKKGKTK